MRTLLLLLVLSVSVGAQDALKARIDEIAQPYLKHVKGMVIGVIPGEGKPPLVIGYGANKPDGNTVYEIGSISKVFTGVLLACLVQEGKVKLTTPVQDLLPEDVRIPGPITLKHLTTHTSGLPRLPANIAPKDVANPYADYTFAQMYAFLSTTELKIPVGTESAYSNLGVALLGHALSRKAGKSYEGMLVHYIAQPLEMTSTRIVLTDDMKKRLAPPHNARLEPAKNWDLPTFAGAGGIRSTVNDMLRFLDANLKPGTKPLDLAMANARKVHYQPANKQAHALGLGWHVSPEQARWHNGGTGGYHSYCAIHLESHTGMVVLGNTAGPAVEQFGSTVMRLLVSGERKVVNVDAQTLKRYVGRYEFNAARGFILTVTVEDGKLMVRLTGQGKLQVFPESKKKFFYKAVDAQLTFVEKDGKITGLILHQNGNQPAKRLP